MMLQALGLRGMCDLIRIHKDPSLLYDRMTGTHYQRTDKGREMAIALASATRPFRLVHCRCGCGIKRAVPIGQDPPRAVVRSRSLSGW